MNEEPMSGRLEGKVALITGSARGQGEAEARRFVAEGARVVITDIRDVLGEQLAVELGPTPSTSLWMSPARTTGIPRWPPRSSGSASWTS